MFEQFDGFRLERNSRRPLERQRADKTLADQERHGEDLTVVLDAGQFGMRRRCQQLLDRARIEDEATLVERLVHGGTEQAHEIHLLAELRSVRDYLDRGSLIVPEAEADARAFGAE